MQRYLHFTSLEDAARIESSGYLMKSSFIDGVYAVAVGGAAVPGVQQTKLGRTSDRSVAIVFETDVEPNFAYPEEIIWKNIDCLPIQIVDILPTEEAVKLLDDSIPYRDEDTLDIPHTIPTQLESYISALLNEADYSDVGYYEKKRGYYSAFPGMSLEDIIYRWQNNAPGTWKHPVRGETSFGAMKLLDDSMPVMIHVGELWTFREYEWTRDTARDGSANWDDIKARMSSEGWNPDSPLIFLIGRNGVSKVGEGNHRLGIARELNMTEVPVRFLFYDNVSLNQ